MNNPLLVPSSPSLRALAALFAKVGFLSFGGAPGQIALMHRLIVEEKRWLDERRYQNALSYCMLLPGPEAQQLATYIGWLIHGVRGGLIAGLLFVLPGALIMLGLSFLYVLQKDTALVAGAFAGIKPAVVAILVAALFKIARRAAQGPLSPAIAALSFLALFAFDVPFPVIILLAALIGTLLATPSAPMPHSSSHERRFSPSTIVCCLIAWWLPVALAALFLGGGHRLVAIGLFFSKLAVLTFGGAYAVLAWLSDASIAMGWVSEREMIDGLGLAETTPGPTILVNQFIAFLASWRDSAPFSPALAATLGATMAVWVTFVPSFLWIFAGAPFMERLIHNPRLAGALAAIGASVSGIIGVVALRFALAVLFTSVGEISLGPLRLPSLQATHFDPIAAFLTFLAFVLLFRWKMSVTALVLLMAAIGIGIKLVAAA